MIIFFLLEKRIVLIIPTRVAIVDISDFSSALCTLLFAFVNSQENPEVETSLEADQRLDIFTMPAGC